MTPWIALLVVSAAGLAHAMRTLYLMTCAASCHVAFTSPYARIFGFPNAAIAVAYFAGLILFAALRLGGVLVPIAPVLVVSALSVVMCAYLAWALAFRVRRWCGVCVTGYALTLAAAGALIAASLR